MKDIIIISDWYEGKELIYRGESFTAAKNAIKQWVYDTAGECDIVCNVVRKYGEYNLIQLEVPVAKLADYVQECLDSIYELL